MFKWFRNGREDKPSWQPDVIADLNDEGKQKATTYWRNVKSCKNCKAADTFHWGCCSLCGHTEKSENVERWGYLKSGWVVQLKGKGVLGYSGTIFSRDWNNVIKNLNSLSDVVLEKDIHRFISTGYFHIIGGVITPVDTYGDRPGYKGSKWKLSEGGVLMALVSPYEIDKTYNLKDYFRDWKHPTKSEVGMFEMLVGEEIWLFSLLTSNQR